MTTPSNAVPGFPADSQVIASSTPSLARPMYWSLRRELWENRSIYIAPLMVAGLFLLGFTISAFRLPARMRAAQALPLMQQHRLIEWPYNFASLLIMGTTFVVALFYCLETLHGERRDRSILFWKSLPVSDLTTVLAKASIPLVILPLLTLAITVVTQSLMLLISTAVLEASGQGTATLRAHFSLFQMSLMLLYHLVGIHALWYAPIYGWLLLVSGWARRAAVLWAALPLLAIGFVEKIAFNTSYFAGALKYRLLGGPEGVPFASGNMPMDPTMVLSPAKFLATPGLWTGLALAAVFLGAAASLRRYRGPI